MAAMEGDAPATTVHIAGIELPDEDVTFKEKAARPHLPGRAAALPRRRHVPVRHRPRADEGRRRRRSSPRSTGSIFTDNAWSTLGLGWLGACIVLSGSPIAASALTLLDGGAINQLHGVHHAHRLPPRRRLRRPRGRHRLRAAPQGCRQPPGAHLDRHPLVAGDDGRLRAGRDRRLRPARPGRVRRPHDRHLARAHLGHRHAVRLVGRPPARSSCPAGRCSRSAWSCCWPASPCSTRCCRPSARRSWSTATRRGTPASGPCSCSGAACAC